MTDIAKARETAWEVFVEGDWSQDDLQKLFNRALDSFLDEMIKSAEETDREERLIWSQKLVVWLKSFRFGLSA
jgi:hypothetical protein